MNLIFNTCCHNCFIMIFQDGLVQPTIPHKEVLIFPTHIWLAKLLLACKKYKCSAVY